MNTYIFLTLNLEIMEIWCYRRILKIFQCKNVTNKPDFRSLFNVLRRIKRKVQFWQIGTLVIVL